MRQMHGKETSLEFDRQVPFSIYLQLEEDSRADFEVVAKASLELIKAMREIAAFAAPEVQIQVALQNGEEGSLRLNSLLRLKGTSEGEASRFKISDGLIIGLVLFLLETTAGHYADKLLDLLDAEISRLIQAGATEEEVEAEAAKVRMAIGGIARNQVGTDEIRRFFGEIERDRAISGVGISDSHHTPPADIVPRAEFLSRATEPRQEEEEITRKRYEEIEIMLVQPRLLGDEKAWRFFAKGSEFSAKLEDRKFVSETLSGKRKLPLVQGVWMRVTMRYDERKSDNAWIVTKRTIEQVHDAWSREPQGSLFEEGNDSKQ